VEHVAEYGTLISQQLALPIIVAAFHLPCANLMSHAQAQPYMPAAARTNTHGPGYRCRCALLTVLLLCGLAAQAQPGKFAIWKSGDVVGQVFVDRIIKGDRIHYIISSYAEVMVLWKQVVRTVGMTEYVNGKMTTCHSSFRFNDSLKDSSHMVTRQGVTHGYIHPGKTTQKANTNPWSTARLYYEEPIGQTSIFVESVLQNCPLERTAVGTYTLTMPDRKVNHYVYRNGVLYEIRVDRSFFDLVFRRL
jgi:hypothetical protein